MEFELPVQPPNPTSLCATGQHPHHKRGCESTSTGFEKILLFQKLLLRTAQKEVMQGRHETELGYKQQIIEGLGVEGTLKLS